MKFKLFCSKNYGTFQMLGDIIFSILKYEKHDLGRQQIFSKLPFPSLHALQLMWKIICMQKTIGRSV